MTDYEKAQLRLKCVEIAIQLTVNKFLPKEWQDQPLFTQLAERIYVFATKQTTDSASFLHE